VAAIDSQLGAHGPRGGPVQLGDADLQHDLLLARHVHQVDDIVDGYAALAGVGRNSRSLVERIVPFVVPAGCGAAALAPSRLRADNRARMWAASAESRACPRTISLPSIGISCTMLLGNISLILFCNSR